MTHPLITSTRPMLRAPWPQMAAALLFGIGASASAQPQPPPPVFAAQAASAPMHPALPGSTMKAPGGMMGAASSVQGMPKHPAMRPHHPPKGMHSLGKRRMPMERESMSAQCAALVAEARQVCIERTSKAAPPPR